MKIILAITAMWLYLSGGTARAQFVEYLETPARLEVAAMVVTGSDPARSVQVIFDPTKLRSDISLEYGALGGSYFIAAALPDGTFHSYTTNGWRKVTPTTLLPFMSRPKGPAASAEQRQRQVIVEAGDLSSLVGTVLYAGIGVGSRLTYSTIGSVLPARPRALVTFPNASGEWRVARTLDALTKAVTCSLTVQKVTFDARYVVRFRWEKTDKTAAVRMAMYLDDRDGYIAFFGGNDSGLQVDSWQAFSLVAGAGVIYYTPPGSAPTNYPSSEGPQQLYGNFEPNLSRMMNGQALTLSFISLGSLRVGYTVQASLQGFAAAVDAFDACVATQ